MSKNSLLLACSFACALLLSSCSKEEPEPPSGNGPVNSSGAWGTLVQIPELSQFSSGYALFLKPTNEGMYFEVTRDDDSDWIYRLQNGGGSPSWLFHEQSDLFFEWAPSSVQNEQPNTLALFYSTISTNGFASINTSTPNLDSPHPAGFSASNVMLIDHSPMANQWAFFGNQVRVKQNNNTNNYDPICNVPNTGGVSFAEADPEDAVIWAAAGTEVYKITVNGDVTTFDVSAYTDPNQISQSIGKIRFCYDPIHPDVYFNYQNKVFRIQDGTNLSLFYTIDNGANFFGGDFALDRSFLYTSDGVKKNLNLGTESSFVPPQPVTTDQAVLLNYITVLSALGAGNIEVSADPLDAYIYTINNDKIVKIPKSL